MPASKRIKDLLPNEVKLRQEVLKKITNIFEQNNYAQIVTPSFEPYEIISKGLSSNLAEVAYKFFDHYGRMMILRPDITTQLARVVAQTFNAEKAAIRLYYSGDVYRAKQMAIGEENQFHQIGIELFNVSGSAGDQEVIKIAEKCLTSLGLKNFEISRTNINEIKKLSKSQQEALLAQDFVAYGRLPEKQELIKVDIDYYTGLYFECFVPELGYAIGAGGRYDNLVSSFGKPKKAVGFAFDLHRLMVALKLQKVI
jgi:ATP phosphoribosyltransferase regulatory subunit